MKTDFISVLTEAVLILLIVYTPFRNAIYGTAPISIQAWLFLGLRPIHFQDFSAY